jgi:hypothetical protein
MWLVFVLHAFCVAAFCTLWALCGAGLLPVSGIPLGGLASLSLPLGLGSLAYTGLQLFV